MYRKTIFHLHLKIELFRVGKLRYVLWVFFVLFMPMNWTGAVQILSGHYFLGYVDYNSLVSENI